MKEILFHKVVIIGVGLIGGSLALDLRRAGVVGEFVGVGRSPENLQRALQLGVIDRATSDAAAAVEGADLVVLATPVGQMAAVLRLIVPHLSPAAIVTDAGSTKRDVAEILTQFLPDSLERCVPAHPIAGSDLSGAAAARFGLFADKNVILSPFSTTLAENVAKIAKMWQITGARVQTMTPQAHDAIFSAVSHLPHVLAFAYVGSLLSREDLAACLALAGSGFRDFSRIAASHPEMWRDIALANRAHLLADIAVFRQQLERIESALAAEDATQLNDMFAAARDLRAPWQAP